MPSADAFLDEAPRRRRSADEFLGEEVSDTIPQVASKPVEPSYVPAEFQQFAEQQAIEQAGGENMPQWITNAAEAASEVAGGFIPRSLGDVAHLVTPLTSSVDEIMKEYRIGRDVLTTPKTYEEATREHAPERFAFVEAQQTPPLSKERFAAGFDTVAQMLMAKAIAGSVKPKAEPRVVEPVRTTQEQLRSEVPDISHAEVVQSRPLPSETSASLESPVARQAEPVPYNQIQPQEPTINNPPVSRSFPESTSIPSETARVKIQGEQEPLSVSVEPTRQMESQPEHVPAFAARFDPEILFQRPAWVEPGSAFDRVLGELRDTRDPFVGKDVTGIWKSLTPAQRQDLAARGWNANPTRQFGQILLNVGQDAVSASKFYGMKNRIAARKLAEESSVPSRTAANPQEGLPPQIPEPIGVEAAEIQRRNAPEAQQQTKLPAQWRGEDLGPDPIPAVRYKDGSILADPSFRTHAQIAGESKLPFEKIQDGGWIVNGEYRVGGPDAANLGDRARAQDRVRQKRALKTEQQPQPVPNEPSFSQPETIPKPNALQENIERPLSKPIGPDIQRSPGETVLRDERIQGRTEGEPRPETVQGAPTSTQNKVTAAERESIGLSEAVEAARRDFGTVWDEAEALARSDATAPQRLVKEIAENPRALTDKENALLLRRQIEAQNEHSAAIEAVNAAPEDAAAISRLETARDELQTVYDAAKNAGTETGRGLNARKMLANQDFTLAKMEAETRAVMNNGKPLSPKQGNEVKALHQRIANAEAKVSAYEAREQFNVELKQARRTGVRPDTFLEQQAQRARERIIARRGKLFADPIGVTQIAHLADEAIIGASHIARGVRTFSDWSKTMVTEFGDRIKPYLQALFAKAQAMHSEAAKASRLTPEQREVNALAGEKKGIITRTEKIRAKTEAGDFEPTPKKLPRMDREKSLLIYEYQKAKEAYIRGLLEAKLSKQSAPRKALRYGGEVLNTARAVMTSFDLSAVLRQGGFVTLGHPIRALRNMPDMFRAFASEKAQFRINEEIKARPNAPLYKQSKLYLADDSGVSLSRMEEAYMSRWANKIPIVAGSQRAYTTFLNKLRADSFDAMAATLSKRGTVTAPEAQAIANFVNVATGRGNMGGAAQAAVALNTVFFAPRYVVSRFQTIAGQPMYGGTMRTRAAIAKEYARFLTGVGIVYALAQSMGADVEKDPRSSDFGKLRFGDTRVDPLSGLSQVTVLLSRLGTGETKTLKGKLVPIRGEKVPYGSGNSADVIARFLRTKLSPAVGGGVDVLAGKNVVGQPVTPVSAATKMMVPLSFGDIYSAMQQEGVEKGSAFAVLALFGMGVTNYANPSKLKSERRMTLDEAMRQRKVDQVKEFLTGR